MSNTKVRYPAVEQFIDNNKDALVRSVQEIVRFPSVEAPAAGPGAPFGEAVRGALENALNLGKSFGFETTNLDGYAGCIDYGCGEEMLGVVAHVDVVPEGEGWIHPPYAAEIADGGFTAEAQWMTKVPPCVRFMHLPQSRQPAFQCAAVSESFSARMKKRAGAAWITIARLRRFRR